MALLLKKGPMSRADIAAATGYSPRHLQRILPGILGIQTVKQGRKIMYSVLVVAAAAAASSSSTTTITQLPEQGLPTLGPREVGHEPGQMSIMDISGDVQHGQVGHFKGKIKADEPPNRERVAKRHREGPSGVADCSACSPGDDHKCRACPLSYAELERDTVQFVIVDQEFRDRLVEIATVKQWRRKTDRGLTWIYQKHLTLQVGGDVVVFYSDEPEDLGHIVEWARTAFSGIYQDINSLLARIKRPHELTRDELTVIVTDPGTIEEMMFHLRMKMEKTGTYYLPSPNPVTPGFKAYKFQGTLRCEFDCRDDKRRVSALTMRRRLLEILPDIKGAPGLFSEYLTDYYNPNAHPTVIDTGVDNILEWATSFAERIIDRCMEKKTTPPPSPEEQKLRELRDAIEALETGELGDIIRTFRDLLNVEEGPTRVYLAAWAIWKGRHCKGRVNKAEIASLLVRQNDPLTIPEIADALPVLRTAGLLQEDPSIEICFSAAGREIAEILMAKREGL